MFAQRSRLRLLGLGLITTGLMACQGQQQQQKEPGQPLDFNAGGFEGLESGQFALLAAPCNTSADPVVITVASGEFAYLYKRTDGNVVVNTNATGGGQCTFASTKNINIVAAESSGNQSHKVLIDYLSGTFSAGSSTAVGIAVDLKTTGVNQVMFRGTINPDVFSLGTVGGVSYLGFATGSATPVTAPTFASVSLTNVSDVTITAGPGDDIIDGQGAAAGMTVNPASLEALDGAISLTVHGGDGADQITSGAASTGTAQNSLNGGNGSDVFHQPSALASDVVSGGTDPTVTLTLTGTATGTDTSVVTVNGTTTATATLTAAGTATVTNSQTVTATATKTITTTGTATAAATITKATSVNTSATTTTTATRTATASATWTGLYSGIGASGNVTGTRTFTGTLSTTSTVTATLTLTATGTTTGTVSVTGSRTATTTNSHALTGLATQTYTSLAVSVTNTSVQTDISVDVVDYSHRTLPVKVTLGDQAVAVAASAKVVLPNSGAIRSYDSFEITDGELTDTDVSTSYTTRVVEFHRAGTYADGTIEVPANGGADLTNDETFTIDDGTHSVTFHILVGAGTNTLSGTATSLNIQVGAGDDRATAAAAIVAGINNYQTATWTGVAVGTATMTSTSIVPNVTVLAPDSGNNDVIAVQNRNSATVATFLDRSDNLTVTTATSASLWNANGANTIAVDFDDATPINADGMATLAQAAVAADTGIAIVAATSTPADIVTITASGTIAVKPDFGVTLKSGGFAITVLSNGTPAAGPGANDGDIAASGEQDSILNDIENVIGGSGNDTIDATNSTNIVHKLFGMAGDDTLIIGTLSSGGDMLYGGPGDDHLLGGNNAQTLFGGNGNDFMAGGPGDDIIDGDGANCVVASTGVYASTICDATFAAASSTAGSNYLDYSDRTAMVTVTLSSTMSGSGRASQIGVASERDDVTNCTNLRGGSAGDSLTGSTGDNIIYGGPGDDTINGGGGNDSLSGDEGDDIVSGDAGDDYVYGGSGVNTLFGDASGYTGTAGINMLDNSQGRNGAVACGAGDMDILFSDGEETGTNSCELK